MKMRKRKLSTSSWSIIETDSNEVKQNENESRDELVFDLNDKT